MKPRAVLIGLDGATWSVLDPLMRDGVMPFLRRFVEHGARASLRSTIPALTPPAWTSMITGRSPGYHGIFNFFGRDAPDSHQIRLLGSQDIGSEPVWAYANRQRLRATVLNFPLTFPAPAIDGQVVAGGWMPWRQLRLGCHPRELYDRLKALPGFDARVIALDMAHEAKALEGCRREEYDDWIALHIRREQQWFAVLRSLMADDPTELLAIVFDGVDKLQHLCWRLLDPAYAADLREDWELRARERCVEYFRVLDGLLDEIVALAGDTATVVMASDHGFGPQERTLFINTWLEQHGYLAWADGAGPRASGDQLLGMSQVARHTYLLDWSRTQAYASMPGGNGIHVVRRDVEHPAGVTDSEYDAFCDRLIGRLGELRDSDTGAAVVRAAWRRDQIFAGPYLELAPDITLELADGGLFSILAATDAVAPRHPPTGTHRPDGIFVAVGPLARPGADIGELSILDVAPLLLYSLDVPIPAQLEGRVPVEALRADQLMARPVRRDAAETNRFTTTAAQAEPVLDADDEDEIMRRLQALGYVE